MKTGDLGIISGSTSNGKEGIFKSDNSGVFVKDGKTYSRRSDGTEYRTAELNSTTNGKLLKYDSSTDTIVNDTRNFVETSTLNNLTSSLTNDNLVKWNGSEFVNNDRTLADIDKTGLTSGDLLKWDGSKLVKNTSNIVTIDKNVTKDQKLLWDGTKIVGENYDDFFPKLSIENIPPAYSYPRIKFAHYNGSGRVIGDYWIYGDTCALFLPYKGTITANFKIYDVPYSGSTNNTSFKLPFIIGDQVCDDTAFGIRHVLIDNYSIKLKGPGGSATTTVQQSQKATISYDVYGVEIYFDFNER